MMNRRVVGVGLGLLIAGGCATQPKPGATSVPIKTSSKQPDQAKVNSPVDAGNSVSPGVDAAPTPAQLLAMKSAEYARSMENVDAGSPGTPQASVPAKALFADPPKITGRNNRNKQQALDAGNRIVPDSIGGSKEPVSSPVEPPAQLATNKQSPRVPAFGDGPQEVAESADYTSTGSGSDSMGQRLLKRARDNPRDICNQLDLQLFGMLNDDQSPEFATMSALSPEDKELVRALVDGLVYFRATVRQDANMLMPQKIKPLNEMIDRIQDQADLSVSNLTLCKRVDSFGKYDPITPARFPAMKESRAIVYCEIANFRPKQNPSTQLWETNLTEEVTLYTDTGLVAWSDIKRQVTDQCRNRRHDFFAYNIISLPGTLSVGRYVLKVSIHDDNGDRVAEDHLQVNVTAQ